MKKGSAQGDVVIQTQMLASPVSVVGVIAEALRLLIGTKMRYSVA